MKQTFIGMAVILQKVGKPLAAGCGGRNAGNRWRTDNVANAS
jgi:hypothetical protein